jgi:hypothetical protein
MELIRCDNCEREVHKDGRYYEIEIGGLLRTGFDPRGAIHLCSESCGAEWFAKRAPTVEEAAAF